MNDSSISKSILLLAANPKGTVSLRLQEEEREIRERLRLAGYGKVPIHSTGATRTRDIQQAMLDFKPQIVHFTGHGAGKDGLAFEDGTGQPKLVDSDALANLFKLFSSRVECVVLNACYSQIQAEAIAQHIDYVIGMSQAIGDRAAIEFSVGFYTALGAGEPIKFAYELGCNAIQLEGISEHLTPVLFVKKSVRANQQNFDEVISSLERTVEIEFSQSSEQTLIKAAEEFFKLGKEAYDLGDYQGAIVDYSESTRLQPDYIVAYLGRGFTKYKLADYQGAIADLNEAIRLRPNDCHVYYCLRGNAKRASKDHQGAIADLTKAIRLQPDAFTYHCRGAVKNKLADYQGAIADFNESIRLQPDHAHAYGGRGWAKHGLKDHQSAIADFNESIRLQPDNAGAYLGRGQAKRELGDKSAIADLDKAIRLQPGNADVYKSRGAAKLFIWGDYQEGIADLNEAICLQPNNVDAYAIRGWAKYTLGDYQGAIVDFNEAIHLQPNNVHAYSGRGYAKYQLADYQSAIADFNESVHLQPDYIIAYNGRGRVKSDLGDKQGAILDYREVMRLCKQKNDMDEYDKALKQIENFEKENKGFWERLFS